MYVFEAEIIHIHNILHRQIWQMLVLFITVNYNQIFCDNTFLCHTTKLSILAMFVQQQTVLLGQFKYFQLYGGGDSLLINLIMARAYLCNIFNYVDAPVILWARMKLFLCIAVKVLWQHKDSQSLAKTLEVEQKGIFTI